MNSNLPVWLTLGEAARHLGISRSVLSTWTDDGRVKSFKTPLGHTRILSEDVDKIANGQMTENE